MKWILTIRRRTSILSIWLTSQPYGVAVTEMIRKSVHVRGRMGYLLASDTLGFMEDQLLVTLGARYQKIELFNYDYSGSYTDGSAITI